MILIGAKGDYVGSNDFLMESLKIVRDVTLEYKNKIKRKELKARILGDEKLAKLYLNAFSLHDMIYINDSDHTKCMKYIKKCLARVSSKSMVGKKV